MSIEIRKIEKKDIAGFHQVLTEVANEGKYILSVPPIPFEKIESFILNNIKHNHAQYVAAKGSEIIAWADIIPSSRNTMSHIGSLGMGVLSTYRKQGIGTNLLSKVIAHAWEQGLIRLELEVFSGNDIAIEMYKQHGYTLEGVKKFARFYKNTYQDIVVMAQYRT